MSLIRRSKKSTDVTANTESPLNEIGDVSAVAAMFARLRQQNAQYDQAIAALVTANRITCGWYKPAEPQMTLTIQREVLVALGDTDALARFDQEHQQALAQEQAARVKAAQQVLEAPTRVKALEQYINDLAGQMEGEYDQISVEREAERIFAPCARRMFDAAKVFVQAWREMQTVEAVLLSRIRLSQYSVTGEYRNWPTLELIGSTNAGELLPTLIEGITLDEIKPSTKNVHRSMMNCCGSLTESFAKWVSIAAGSRSITPRPPTTCAASTPPIPIRRRNTSTPATACRPSCAWMCEGCCHGNPAFPPAPAGSLWAAVAAHSTRARGAGALACSTAAIATASARRHHVRLQHWIVAARATSIVGRGIYQPSAQAIDIHRAPTTACANQVALVVALALLDSTHRTSSAALVAALFPASAASASPPLKWFLPSEKPIRGARARCPVSDRT